MNKKVCRGTTVYNKTNETVTGGNRIHFVRNATMKGIKCVQRNHAFKYDAALLLNKELSR
jgi:hypothetical protein